MKLLTATEALTKETDLLADFYHAQPISRLVTAAIPDFSRESAQQLFETVQKHIPMCTKLLKDTQYAATSNEKKGTFIVFEQNNEYGIVVWQEGTQQMFVTERNGFEHLPSFYEAFCTLVKTV